MKKRTDPTMWFFDRIVLRYPVIVLSCLFIVIAVLGYHARYFRIEASSETLIQQDNKNYLYYQKVIARYGFEDYVVITYTPRSGDILDDEALSRIARLRDEIARLHHVDSVLTLLDVPLLESPPRPLRETIANPMTLSDPGVDKGLARKELRTSPLYEKLLVSEDLRTTALQINFRPDPLYDNLWKQRQQLRQKIENGGLTPEEEVAFTRVRQEIEQHRGSMDKMRHDDILAIRSIMVKYDDHADLFLGGLSIIADDMMRFIMNDIEVFSGGVFLFLILALGLIFKRVRWVLLPMISCAFSVISMVGILGLFRWPVTIVSANFIALQLIITMAISIHLVVRFRELIRANPHARHRDLTREMVLTIKTPIFYAVLTTIAGFSSLLFSGILPVITFGWMMSAGILMSLVVTMIFFPAALLLFKKTPPPPAGGSSRFSLTDISSRFTEKHGRAVLVVSAAALILSAVGISRLRVENSFLNYFKSSTDIAQGLKVIDRQLGGTTPLDIVIDLGEPNNAGIKPENAPAPDNTAGIDEFGEFSEFDGQADPAKYWFTPNRLKRIEAVHDYLNGLPHTGKVLSLATLYKIAEKITDGPLDTFELSLLFNQFPERYRDLLINPYVSVENNQTRISLRVVDTHETLRRNALLNDIDHELKNQFGFADKDVHLTGMLVLYNDVLQQLFDSQILTIGLTLLLLMGMFLVLFRSLKISLIALFPNLLSITCVLGAMGWLDIPLDIMTITIASISVGIAVDDTIHYIHRFRREIRVDGDYIRTMHRCHRSIGYAMFYTSVTIVAGFSILVLSNFIPTITFGLFTGLAMVIALLAALTLLPKLIILTKPFGPHGEAAES